MSSSSSRAEAPGSDAPLRALERIPILDVLRGLAILGMFVVHLNYFQRSPGEAGPDPAAVAVAWTISLFFEGEFYAVFCVLFGVGFAVQLARADARGDRFVPRYLRRLFALAVFGFIADGVFRYNVLFVQAIWGLPLLIVRRWSIGALIGLLVLCAASRPLYDLARVGIYGTRPDGVAQLVAADQEATRRFNEDWAAVEAAEKSGDWRTVIAGRMEFMPKYYRRSILLPGQNFTLFLLGMIVFRLGLLDRPERHRRLIATFMIGGAVSWAFAIWALPIGGPSPSPSGSGAILDAATTLARTNAFMLVRKQWLILTYIGAILLLVAHNAAWLRRLAPLRWAGRMALTNYVAHVILLEVLFAPHGFGLGLSAPMVFGAALLLFAGHALVSRWWLSRFTAGPLEWLWRWFTYWERPVLRRRIRSRAPAAAPA